MITPSTTNEAEIQLVAALRAGDEHAFAMLVERYHTTLLRLARMYVATQAQAEEVVQETWVGVLQGLARFEGRASLKTWIFRILVNRARSRGQRERRSIPFSELENAVAEPDEPAVEPERFFPSNAQHPGGWVSLPTDWEALPEDRVLASETRARIEQAIENLPASQREVITLRDVEGWSAEEVRNALHITEANQRVLLHRARSKVRSQLEQYLTAM